MSNVALVGEYMRNKLECIEEIVEVRGKGLMLGAQLKPGIDAHDVVENALLSEKLVINATGDDTLRFLPPLVITKGDVDEFIVRLERAIKASV